MDVKRKPRRRKRPIDVLVESTTPVVLSESTRMYVEKMVADLVREMHADPTYKAELRETVRRVFERDAKLLRGHR